MSLRRRSFPWVVPIALVALSGMVSACGTSAGTKTDAAGSTPVVSSSASGAHGQLESIKLPADIAASHTMKVGVSTLYPPYVYLDNNELAGYEYDILNAIAKEMGVKFEYQRVEFASMIPGVQAKRFDMAASGMSDFADREKIVDFIDYTGSYTAILARKAANLNIHGWMDLCGLTVGVPQGTSGQRSAEAENQKCSAAGKPAMKISIFQDAASLLVALEAGRVDAMPQGIATAVYNASKLPDKLQMVDTKDQPSPIGAVVLKGNDELTNAVAAAVHNLDEKGTLLAIHKKWHLEPVYLHPTGINLGK